MKIRYFTDTDTLYIEFRDQPIAETHDLDENTVLDVDAKGNICAITVEHASERTGIPDFSYEQGHGLTSAWSRRRGPDAGAPRLRPQR